MFWRRKQKTKKSPPSKPSDQVHGSVSCSPRIN
jgi:hypothetical protein